MTQSPDHFVQEGQSPSVRAILIGSIVVGTMIRMGLALISDGSNDAVIWHDLGELISQRGLLETYRHVQGLNHPPLAALWSVVAVSAGMWFSFVMKLPAIMGDALAVALVGKIWLERQDVSRARWGMISMALSPLAIIISGYHCNTDNLYAYLSLLAMYLLGSRRAFFWGGLALGAAINVKLIPVLLILPAISLCRNWREFAYLVGALAFWTLPFLPLVFSAWNAVKSNMLAYNPPVSMWGVVYILKNISEHEQFASSALAAIDTYRWLGRLLTLAAVALLSGISFWRRQWSGLELGTMVYGIFLVLAPGFGNQYLVILVPLLLAVSIPRSWLYACLATPFISLMYIAYLVKDLTHPTLHRFPYVTLFPESGPAPGALFGLLAWWVLLTMVVCLVSKGFGRKQETA